MNQIFFYSPVAQCDAVISCRALNKRGAVQTDSIHIMSGFRFIFLTKVKIKSYVNGICEFGGIQIILKLLIKTLHNSCDDLLMLASFCSKALPV